MEVEELLLTPWRRLGQYPLLLGFVHEASVPASPRHDLRLGAVRPADARDEQPLARRHRRQDAAAAAGDAGARLALPASAAGDAAAAAAGGEARDELAGGFHLLAERIGPVPELPAPGAAAERDGGEAAGGGAAGGGEGGEARGW